MLARSRRQLAMGARVRDFFRKYPSDDPAVAVGVAALDGLLGRADVLARQFEAGTLSQRASLDRRQQLRRVICTELLPHLVRVGQVLGKDHPDLAGRFRIPAANAPYRAFIDSTRRMLDLAGTVKELFLAKGLSPTLLDDLSQAVAEFDAATVESHGGRQDHVGASADLRQVAREIVAAVRVLDGLNRYRLRGNAELKAAWDSARDVIGPFRVNGKDAEGKTPPTGEAAPAA